MSLPAGHTEQQRIIPAAILKSREALLKRGTPEGRLAADLKDATTQNWYERLAGIRTQLRRKENRINQADIQQIGLKISPDNAKSTVRDNAEDRLNRFREFTEQGFEASSDQANIRSAIDHVLLDRPDFAAELAKSKNPTRIIERMAKDPGFRRKVQERVRDLSTDTRFDTLRTQVQAAQGELQTEEDTLQDKESKKKDAEQRKKDAEDKKKAFDTDPKKKPRLDDFNRSIDPKTRTQYEQKRAELDKRKQELNEVRQNLTERSYDRNDSRLTSLRNREATLQQEVTNGDRDMNRRFSACMEQDVLAAEQAHIEGELTNTTAEEKQFTQEVADQQKIVKEKQDRLTDFERRYQQIEDEFMDDIDNIYAWAAEDYLDDQIGEYLQNWDPVYGEHLSEAEQQELQGLTDKMKELYFADRVRPGFSREEGFHLKVKKLNKGKVRQHFDKMIDTNPEKLLEDPDFASLKLTPEQMKRIAPHLAKNLVGLRMEMGVPPELQLRQLRMAPWAQGRITELAANDPAFAQSLRDFDNGKTHNVAWIYALMGAMTIAQAIARQAEEEE